MTEWQDIDTSDVDAVEVLRALLKAAHDDVDGLRRPADADPSDNPAGNPIHRIHESPERPDVDG